MKKFYYKITNSKVRRGGGGQVQTAEIFTAVSGGTINKVGTAKWDTAAYKGDHACIYKVLYEKGLLTKKEIAIYEANDGYYLRNLSTIEISRL